MKKSGSVLNVLALCILIATLSKRENQTLKRSKNRRCSNALTGIMSYSYRVEIYKHDEFSTLIHYTDLYVKFSHSLLFFII